MADNDGNLWKQLELGVNHIMINLEDGLSYQRYMELYTSIYNYCTGHASSMNFQSSTAATSSRSSSAASGVGANLMGGFLYENLQNYLKRHLLQVKQSSDGLVNDNLLAFYSREWKRFSTAAVYINRVFSYLNRHWVKREVDEGHRNVYDVYTLCLVSWRDYFFMSIHNSLTSAFLNAILRHRNGESVDALMLKSISSSFTVLGLDEMDTSRRTLDIYKKYFETAFISATRLIYSAESKSFLASNSVVDYLRKCETRLAEEQQRVELYLDSSTLTSLITTCETVLITDHKDVIIEEFASLLLQFKTADLQRTYRLVSRIPNGLDPLKDKFESHVKQRGLDAVENLVNSTQDPDPKSYVDTLLQVYKTFHDLVVSCFDNDAGFMGSMDKACRDFVNRNALCTSGTSKSPEYLARYSDTLLKKNAKGSEESDIDTAMNNIMAVFKYIEDKDVFQKFYSKMLAKRLVYDSSSSEEAEENMINKLKEACGFEYTSRLSRMFTDMNLSKDLNEGFKSRVDQSGDSSVDFYIKVLATGSWPLQPPTSPFNIPLALEGVYTRFQAYYSSQHSGRKLTWLFHLSHGELKTNYLRGPNNAKVSYIMMVYTYTMAVLLAYNDNVKLTGTQLLEITGLNEDSLKSQLQILLKARLVTASGGNGESGGSSEDMSSLDLAQEFGLNSGFKSKKIRVNLKVAVKSEQKAESDETHKTIEEDRKLLIQAAIVRIMKTRRVLKHVALIDEVITQLQSRFKPKIPDIKKCIDILLEKEYIERNGQEYSYLA